MRFVDVDRIPLIAGHPALDFVNTVEGRGTGNTVNYLTDYRSLALWSARAGLISAPSAQALVRQVAKQPAAARRVWAEAMALKECLNRMVRAIAASKAPPRPAAVEFNALLARALTSRRLAFAPSGQIEWQWVPATGPGLETLLWEIVLSAANLFADRDKTTRIKVCANGPCDWVFLDTSRNGLRRWCRMDVCGNVSKVRRFRSRHRTGA
jgi:predicted RNA-binding Zn ribbon-like protein